MGYRLVKGRYVLRYETEDGKWRASQPDGDSVWFAPDSPAHLSDFEGRDARFSVGGTVQLRLDGIDALEVHYQGGHQPLELAHAARAALLRRLGFERVVLGPTGVTVAESKPRSVRGYIAVRGVDETESRRPIALAFTGSVPESSGRDVLLGPAHARKSVNVALARSGLVYPMIYTTLPIELRRVFWSAIETARTEQRGLWAPGVDRSVRPTKLRTRADLERVVLWPKLYRRLHDYLGAHGDLSRFDAWLRAEPASRDDMVLVRSLDDLRALHNVFRVEGDRISMRFDPIDLVVASSARVVRDASPSINRVVPASVPRLA